MEKRKRKRGRQIDYVMISRRYRNNVRKAQIIPGWKEDMAQQRQHGVIRMEICLKLMRKYKTPKQKESGAPVKYDIDLLRKDPEKIHRRIRQREEFLSKITKKLQTIYGNN